MLESGIYFAERYEIIETIGTGGMSDVYKAKDHMLGRDVAIKVLKQEYAQDVAFVSKFRQEAQSAAGLEHPNIVNIYDVGSENGLYYIVMEYVQGVTLKTYINKKTRLNYKEVISIAIQVGRGIEAAHNNNIIHRDIKPQNIMISKEGKVKVMDFGIARAATSHTINAQTMGSVHYSSPEQARNGYVGFQSDIYSLGIVMYEMVTGQLPFDGDTTVAVAIQHLQSEITPPSVLVEDLPIAVEKIILKCTMKSPERRYQTMEELLTDLKKAYVDPTVDFVVIPEIDGQTKWISEDDLKDIEEAASSDRNKSADEEDEAGQEKGSHTGTGGKPSSRGGSRSGSKSGTKSGSGKGGSKSGSGKSGSSSSKKKKTTTRKPQTKKVTYDDDDDDDDDEGFNPAIDRIINIVGIAAVIVIILIVIYLLASFFGLFSPSGRQTETGTSEEIAATNDAITSQEVDPDNQVVMPTVVGMTKDVATATLNNVSLGCSFVEAPSDIYPEGQVSSASYEAGTKLAANTTVTLTISTGKSDVTVLSVLGYDEASAQEALTAAGFEVKKEYTYSADVEAGKVISQTPSANEAVEEGTAVTIYISRGVETVEVPNVVGMDLYSAQYALEQAGLKYAVNNEAADATYGIIISQSVAGGKQAQPGSTITITMSLGNY